MSKTVISTFPNKEAAERAVNTLRQQGYDKEISVIAKDNEKQNNNEPDTLTDGTSTGGVLGGLAGLAVGAGALAIPGVGPIIAAGPIAGLLSGAAAGGIAGGLVDYGIPKERSEYYEGKVKQGHALVSVQAAPDKTQNAAEVLRREGAQDVEVH
jgi:uncharacterized membrane protein